MNSKELSKIIDNLKRFEGNITISSAPVIHDGFPSCFNLSFAEYGLLKKYGQYLDFDSDFIFSKYQPCIRHQDWNTIISDKDNRYRYLSLFDMVDISGFVLLKDGSKKDTSNKFVIKSFVDFIKQIGLDAGKLRISYFDGSPISEATKGKYDIKSRIQKDPMIDYWKSLGLTDEQFIPDGTRDTLLSLRIFGNPTAWGYRNEINYEYKDKLLDIGTVECLYFKPVFNEKQEIIDIKESEHVISISAIGFERILMVLNNLDNVWEVDHIIPIIDKFKSLGLGDQDAMIATQAIRAIHRIVTDGGEYQNLNTRRKEYVRFFYKGLFTSFYNSEAELTDDIIFDILELNSNLNFRYPELKSSINQTKDEILKRKFAFENDRSIKNKGV